METIEFLGDSRTSKLWVITIQVFLSLVILFLFLFSLELVTVSAAHLDSGFIKGLIQITSNPFVSFFIGLQITAFIQSSSTLTSTIVAMVAADMISMESVVPMVLGANIGTTVTSLIVSFSNLGTPKAFRRGFMVASSHVWFNVLTSVLFLLLEIEGKFLSSVSQFLAGKLSFISPASGTWVTFRSVILSPVSGLIQSLVEIQPIFILGLSLLLLFICIYLFTVIFRWIIMGEQGEKFLKRVLKNPRFALLSGIGMTAAIHSSSVTTSLSVMLASSEKIAPRRFFPFIVGANVGTTITALMAAIGRSDSALAIALCHFIMNSAGAFMFYPFPIFRNIPIGLAKWTAALASRNLGFGFGFLILIFFALPFLVILISTNF